MTGNFMVKINVPVMKWAIERSGYDLDSLYESIFKRFKTKYFTYDYFNDILEGKLDPRFSDLKKIDSFLKRGIPFYFLPFIPEENILTELRASMDIKFSPEAELTLRRYNELRLDLNVLLNEHSGGFERMVDLFSTDDDPLKVAKHIREVLGYLPSTWIKKTSKEVFEHIRLKIEALNVFVFKDELVDEMRGCILIGGDLPPLILIRSNDDKNGEIFTLLHEFAHYLLNNEDVLFIDWGNDDIERWCNEVTSLVLMDPDEERKEGISPNNWEGLMSRERIETISKDYKMSKNAVMLRFLKNGIISESTYRSFLEAYKKEEKRTSSGGGNYHNTNRDRLSRKFISLVHKSYSEGYISLHDTLNYMRIKDSSMMKHYLEVVR